MIEVGVEIIIDGKRGKEIRIPLAEFQGKIAHRLTHNLAGGSAKSLEPRLGMAVATELIYVLLDKIGSVRWIFSKAGLRKRLEAAIDDEVREYLFKRLALAATDAAGNGVHDAVDAAIRTAVQDLVDERRG